MATYMYPKNQPHPHAELMAQYAEDAKETDKPWERWEMWSEVNQKWQSICCHPPWHPKREFRRKPQTVKVEVELTKKDVKDLQMLVELGLAEDWEYNFYDKIKEQI